MTSAVFPAARVLAAATLARQHRLDISVPRDDPEVKRLGMLIGFASAVVENGAAYQAITLSFDDYALMHGHFPPKGKIIVHVAARTPKIAPP